jgi:nicotinate-nucleotide pyrophosphorylase (carboxylating)
LKTKSNLPHYISQKQLVSSIKLWLAEDIGDGDHTTLATINANKKGKAQLIIKENGILAGVYLARLIAKEVSKSLKINELIADGTKVKKGDVAFTVEGNEQAILMAERLLLNCLQRMSGIATKTNYLTSLCSGTSAKLLDTRKTTPGMRILEKWAVKIGGGENHRIGLYDMILIKDNHVDYCGGITNAIKHANDYLKTKKKNLKIEIEVRTLAELKEVMAYGKVHRILLDNFTPQEIKNAVKIVNGKYITEASGGITEKNIRAYAKTGVDYISSGALTHNIKSIDMSLKAFK